MYCKVRPYKFIDQIQGYKQRSTGATLNFYWGQSIYFSSESMICFTDYVNDLLKKFEYKPIKEQLWLQIESEVNSYIQRLLDTQEISLSIDRCYFDVNGSIDKEPLFELY